MNTLKKIRKNIRKEIRKADLSLFEYTLVLQSCKLEKIDPYTLFQEKNILAKIMENYYTQEFKNCSLSFKELIFELINKIKLLSRDAQIFLSINCNSLCFSYENFFESLKQFRIILMKNKILNKEQMKTCIDDLQSTF